MVIRNVDQLDIFANTPHAVDPTQVRYFTGKPCRHGHIADRYVKKGNCVICHTTTHVLWCNANKELRRAFCRAWDIQNLERRRATNKAWKVANPVQYRATLKAWKAANPDSLRQSQRTNRAKRNAATGSHSKAQVATLYILQKAKCGNCGTCLKRGYHVDHKMPLARGGTNDIANLECLCPSCNNRKRAKLPAAWAKENGRLV